MVSTNAFHLTNLFLFSHHYIPFTLSTQSIILNYPVILSHWCSTTVSLQTYPFYYYKCSLVSNFLDGESKVSLSTYRFLFDGKSFWLILMVLKGVIIGIKKGAGDNCLLLPYELTSFLTPESYRLASYFLTKCNGWIKHLKSWEYKKWSPTEDALDFWLLKKLPPSLL